MRNRTLGMKCAIVACGVAATLAFASAAFAEGVLSAPDGAAEESTEQDASTAMEYGYREYLSDRTPTGYTVGWGDLGYDEGITGGSISLLKDGQETTFEHGLAAHAFSSICYNDVQEYGYERFESWVGVGDTARGKAAKVEFRVVADGQVVWSSGEMTAESDAQFVSVDLSGVKVLQLEAVDLDKGAAPYNHAIWADASFCKAEATPWLSVSDKEFSIPDQVTSENILEGVFARTLSGEPGQTDQPVTGSDGTLRNGKEGNDLSDAVTYTTDYVEGQTGSFTITYTVKDEQGYERSRTVGMTVRDDELCRLDADIDYLTTPFASYLYAGRDYFDEQGKAAFDLSVKTLLEFGDNVDAYPLITRWNEQVYQVTVALQDAGIYLSTSDAAYLCSTIMDDEPRTFHVKDWDTVVSAKNGLADTVTFYVAKKYGEVDESGQSYYHARLLETEANASRFLANVQEGMTDAQRLRAVLYPYADWLQYGGSGQVMDEALADGLAVCGGNARGSVYLSQRIGIKAYWVRTDSHAWSNVKLNHDDSGNSEGAYYRIDLLARPDCFLSKDADHVGFHGHHNAVYFNRAKGYPDMTTQDYPFAWTAWPSMTIEVEDSIVVLAPADAGTFDARSLLQSASSVYDGDVADSVQIDDGGLEERRTEAGFAPGFYELTFTAEDSHGNTVEEKASVQVVEGDVRAAEDDVLDAGGSVFTEVSLWNGSQEVVYADGIRQNEAKSATFDVEGKGYAYFDAWVGINGTVRANTDYGMNGKVKLEVWAQVRLEDGSVEDRVLYASPIMGWYAVQEHVLVALPENAVTVTLKNVPQGSGNNHAAWGNPRFYTGEVLSEIPTAPVVSDVEDGALYHEAVAPTVTGARTVELYRKNLSVVVDQDTGTPGVAASSTADADWGELVAGYQAGDAIETDGAYTLVATNAYGQQTIVRFAIEMPVVRIAVPAVAEGLVYDGTAHVGVPAGEGYDLAVVGEGAFIDEFGNACAVEAGTYQVTATPQKGWAWLDGSVEAKVLEWTIEDALDDEGSDDSAGDDAGTDDSGQDDGQDDVTGEGDSEGEDAAGDDGAGSGDAADDGAGEEGQEPGQDGGSSDGPSDGSADDGSDAQPDPDAPAEDAVQNPDGSTTTVVTNPDGSRTETTVALDGTSVVVSIAANGDVLQIVATVGQQAVEAGATVLPIDSALAGLGGGSSEIIVRMPEGASVKVTVPVVGADGMQGAQPGDVLVEIGEDGTETVLSKTWFGEEGLTLRMVDGMVLKVVHAAADFIDVDGTEWFSREGVVDFVSSRDIVRGVLTDAGTVEFQGAAAVTRGMVVTMLYRLESQPAVTGEGFADVPAESWFALSSAWALQAGIATGNGLPDGTVSFDGDQLVTREQVAAFCYRYAQTLGVDTSIRADMGAYVDEGSVSSWAHDALSWAVGVGLLKGDGDAGTLRPGDGATRAELSAVAMRLVGLLSA